MLSRVTAYLRQHHLALLALFVALGGTSYAAVRIPAGSVGTRQLRNGAVTQRKVSKQIRRLLHARSGPAGPRGPAGPAGPRGRTGATGPRGRTGARGATGAAGAVGATGPAGAAGASTLMGSWLPESNTGTDLGPPNGGARMTAPAVAGGATDNDVAALSSAADTVARDLAVGVQNAPGTGRSWTVTLRVNSADTALTCSIAGDATSCDSGGVTVSIPKKSTLSFKIEPTGTPSAAPIYFGWRLTSGS